MLILWVCRASHKRAAWELGLDVRLSENLRERFYGAFQGHDSDEINDKFPAEYIEWQTRDPGFSPPGDGESQRVFYHRIVHAMEPIVAAHAGGRSDAALTINEGAWAFCPAGSDATDHQWQPSDGLPIADLMRFSPRAQASPAAPEQPTGERAAPQRPAPSKGRARSR